MSEYKPPQHVMDEWRRQCDCCQMCSEVPCDGVMAGDFCDNLCDCDDEYEDYRYCDNCGGDLCDCDML
ncbi:hypothetical protein LCGC14_1704200 [marine sediment metagenome]|uniref:Uncharacterized protein n=1 Tax=marine sediment metagenome TaxID=412755 RepID=A0A0F9JXL8_9ZZZZ